jgi:hypothetical protein
VDAVLKPSKVVERYARAVTSALEKFHKGVDKPQQHPLVQVGKMISTDAITKAEFDEALSRYPALLKSISDAKKRRSIFSHDDYLRFLL